MFKVGNILIILQPGCVMLPIKPAILFLSHQQGDDIPLGKAEQCLVVSSSMWEDCLHFLPFHCI